MNCPINRPREQVVEQVVKRALRRLPLPKLGKPTSRGTPMAAAVALVPDETKKVGASETATPER